MAYQLIYTSSPVSLVHGRTGFSTVARSAEMSEKLAAAVERCGVYDIPRGVVFSHRIISVGLQTWHVLSRICDAGVDYTNRNNYIAHHLVVNDAETELLANPAEILLQWDGWLDSWDKSPEFLGNVLGLEKIKNQATLPAEKWGAMFGDSGCAALLHEKTLPIIADVCDSKKVLELFSESLILNVNSLDSWKTTFTTAYFESENAADFIWKTFVGSENGYAECINLRLRKAPNPPSCRATDYARSGELTNRERFNLKVATAPAKIKNLNVVDTPEKAGLDVKKLILFAVGFSVIAVIAILAVASLLDTDDSPQQPQGKPLPSLKITVDDGAQKLDALRAKVEDMTSAQLREEIKVNIEKCDFAMALNLWDVSKYSKNDPSYREKILSDIGYKADSLMRSAENVFESSMASAEEKSQARKDVLNADKALGFDGIPRKNSRMQNLEILKKKVGK